MSENPYGPKGSSARSAWDDGYRAGAEAAARQVTELRAAVEALRPPKQDGFSDPSAFYRRAITDVRALLSAGDKAEAPLETDRRYAPARFMGSD